MRKLLSLSLIFLILLSGCYDKTELENRAFVLSIGIDKTSNGKVLLSQSLPDVRTFAERNGQEDVKTVIICDGETLEDALKNAVESSSKKMDYGHTKLCVFSDEVLKDEEMFRASLETLEADREFSREMLTLATDRTAEEILNASPEGEPMVGLYVSDFFEEKRETGGDLPKPDLQNLLSEAHKGGRVKLPKITLEGEGVRIDGGGER